MSPRKQVSISFVLGAGVVCLFAASLTAAVYNAIHDLENTYTYLSIGIFHEIHIIAILIIVFSLITALLLFIAFFIGITNTSPCMTVLGTTAKVVSYVMFLASLIVQIIGLSKTRYGNYKMPTVYDDYADEDFKKYVDNIYLTQDMGLTDVMAELNITSVDDFRATYPDAFMEYVMQSSSSFESFYVPVCDISSSKKLDFNFTDICDWVIEDSNCIGDWKGSHFAGYLCKRKFEIEDREEKVQKDGELGGIKYDAAKQRHRNGVGSFASFFVMNCFFVGFEAFGFILLSVTMIMKLLAKDDTKDTPEPAKKEEKKPEPVKKAVEKKPEPAKKVEEVKKSDSDSDSSFPSSTTEDETTTTTTTSDEEEEKTESSSTEEEEVEESSSSSSSEEEEEKDELSPLSSSSSSEEEEEKEKSSEKNESNKEEAEDDDESSLQLSIKTSSSSSTSSDESDISISSTETSKSESS